MAAIGRGCACVCLFLATVDAAIAQDSAPPARYANTQLPDPQAEQQAVALMHSIRCLVCEGQSIADSDASLAGDMRSLVRERIAKGETPEAIREWLVERYGAEISYDPPKSGATLMLWLLPLLLLVGAAAILFTRIRRSGQ